MSADPLTTRLPKWLDQAIREYCRDSGLGVSAGMKHLLRTYE